MNTGVFEHSYEVKWAEVDLNGHARHSVYGDFAVDVRVRLLAERGFSVVRLREMGIGPVLLKDETEYRREVLMGETIMVNVRLAGISSDGSHWRFEHEVFKSNGKMAACLRVVGGWLDLASRHLVAPPPELERLLVEMERTEDFEELPSLLRP